MINFIFFIDNVFIYYVFWYQSVLVSNYLQISSRINSFLYFYFFYLPTNCFGRWQKCNMTSFITIELSWIKIMVCKLFSGKKIAADHQVVIKAPLANSWNSNSKKYVFVWFKSLSPVSTEFFRVRHLWFLSYLSPRLYEPMSDIESPQ